MMRRLIGMTACISLLALGGAARAAAPDPDTQQFVCDLTGDCNGADRAVDSAIPAAPTPKGTPRASATRGFSFNRATTAGTSPAATRPGQMASVVQRPVQIGSTDLRVTFVSGSAILTDPAKQRLDKYVAALGDPRLARHRVRIEGHTDASGSQRTNLTLSRRRAQAVADYLVNAGLSAQRFDVVGYGASKPLPNLTPDAAANRRVMAVLL